MPTTAEKIAALRTAAAASTAYADIVPLFTSVYGYIDGREQETGISLTLEGINPADRLGNGFPLVSPLDLHVDHPRAVAFLVGVIDVLAAAGREGHQELARFRAALLSGAVDPVRLFAAILERRRAPLDEAAATAAVPAPLVEYILEIPLRTALELAATTMAEDVFADWDDGSCPFCGSRAGMAELVGDEGRRYLSCGTCSARWAFKRLKCPYCGTEDGDQLAYFTAEEGSCRVDTCRACSRYIKTRDTRQGNSQVPLEVEDLLTIHLDLLATREGFERGK